MNKILLFSSFILLICMQACKEDRTAIEILRRTVESIDTIETIYYKQDMRRSNPQNPMDTIFRYREMYFERLVDDSIVGVKGHWFMYLNDKENVIFEDIFDGNRLIRKNNRDSVARVYDLVKYPDFKKKHFWSHNTLFGVQYEFKYILENAGSFSTERQRDTIIDGQACSQILIGLTDKATMPGFATRLVDSKGSNSRITYFIDKKTFNPLGMKGLYYSSINPGPEVFLEQAYYDIQINMEMDEKSLFNTSEEILVGFDIREIIPE